MFYSQPWNLIHRRPVRVVLGAVLVSLTLLAAGGCSRRPSSPTGEKIAILRFENLSADASSDWVGRGLSEVITGKLAGSANFQVLDSARLHGLDGAMGVRPASAPGISTEREQAIVSGATRIGYGYYHVRGGRLEARLEIEDPRTRTIVKSASTSQAAGAVLAAAGDLVGQLSEQRAGFGTTSDAALEAYVRSLESNEPGQILALLNQAVAADSGFLPAYRRLARLSAGQGDRAGAQAVLERGLAQAGSQSERERARVEMEVAELRGDLTLRRRALTTLTRLEPLESGGWRALADLELASHRYPEAVAAYQKALAIDPQDVALLNQSAYASAYAGNLDAALDALRRYQKLRPSDANVRDTMGDVYLLTGRLPEAEKSYLEADRQNPNFQGGGSRYKAAMARLMSGDVAGADALQKQFAASRAAAQDAALEYRNAEWSWITGKRKEACLQLEAFARRAEAGPLRELASRAYVELSVWKLLMGDRATATQAAAKGASLAGPPSAAMAELAGFLAQPPAPASEWAVRAARLSPVGVDTPVKKAALAYALLLNGHFQAAAEALRELYASGVPVVGEGLPVLLAWTYVETGRIDDAARLLQSPPLPSPNAASPLQAFYFPRFFYLRGVVAAKQGRTDDERANFQIFNQLSGTDPLIWGDEKKAR